MADYQHALLPFYACWERYQQHLVAAIAPLTVEQLALRTTPHHWSIGMYVTHIVANRAWWFHVRISEGGDEVTPYELWRWGSARRTLIQVIRRRNWSPGWRKPGS